MLGAIAFVNFSNNCRSFENSLIIPYTFTMLPGVVFFSILGSTKSSFKKTFSLFGCSPPSKFSGASSINKCWASNKSLLNNLKCPFLPQEHLEGSLNLVSNCNMVIVLLQLGHSNLALVTCGLTSEACLTIPSTTKNLFICSLLISLIFKYCPCG